jgi:hypothetical protein
MTTETFNRAGTTLGETMVVAVLGPKRRGKTLLASKLCYEFFLSGGRVMHLGNLSFGEQVDDIGMLADQDPAALSNVLLYIDEVKAILNSRRSNSAFQQLIFNNLMQAGHQGLSMIFTTQFQHGVSSDLLDQCDYALVVSPQSYAEKWRKRDGYYGPKLKRNNLCPGFNSKDPFHHEHAGAGKILACRDAPEKRTILYKSVTQASHPLGPGKTTYKVLHCAQRFYGLSDTTHKVDALGAMLFNTDQLRARQEANELDSYRGLIHALVDQVNADVMTPAQIHGYLHSTPGMPQWDLRKVKSMSKALGMSTVSTRDQRLRIRDWVSSQ